MGAVARYAELLAFLNCSITVHGRFCRAKAVIVEAGVELSSVLQERIASDTVDFIIVPKTHISDRFVSTHLAAVGNAWMCIPGLVKKRGTIPLSEISQFPLLIQGNLSGTGMVYGRFLQENGVNAPKALSSNNLVAQIGLTLSGIGISYLPRARLQYLVSDGVLSVIKSNPPLPPVEYVALYRADHAYALNSEIAKLASACCDLSSLLLQPKDARALRTASRM
jgi:DNA-binding transcriptional LysR family regulator